MEVAVFYLCGIAGFVIQYFCNKKCKKMALRLIPAGVMAVFMAAMFWYYLEHQYSFHDGLLSLIVLMLGGCAVLGIALAWIVYGVQLLIKRKK